MSRADAWLDDIVRAGGDIEPPPLPNIPKDYLPRPRKKCPTSSPLGDSVPTSSPAKRKQTVLVEIDLPNKDLSKPREDSAVSSPKRQRSTFAEIKTLNMAPRSRSPIKKATTNDRNVDENTYVAGDVADLDATPRQIRRSNRTAVRGLGEKIIPLRSTPSIRGQSSASVGDANGLDHQDSSVDESADSKNSKRSLSPTKRMVDLRVAEKKIEEKGITSPSDVPSDVQGLHLDVQTLGMSGYGIVPMEIKEEVEKACKGIEPFLPFMIASQGADMDREQLAEELKEIIKIRNGTSFCNNQKVHEPSWNERVHSRILQQAVDHLSGLEYHNITTARVLRELIPENKYGETLKKKMVDYAITLGDPVIAESDVIARLGPSVGRLRRTINPSDYSPLCYDPIAISIETKTPDGSEQEAKVQLSIWVMAQFNRLRDLLPAAVAQEPVSITLPLLFVSGEHWTLFFARDRDDSIDIIGSILIGSTTSILGCYKILAAIRCLCNWATKTFKDWFVDNILTPE